MKKTEFISMKIDPETKEILQKIADEKEWTLSHLLRHIVELYIKKRPAEPAKEYKGEISSNI